MRTPSVTIASSQATAFQPCGGFSFSSLNMGVPLPLSVAIQRVESSYVNDRQRLCLLWAESGRDPLEPTLLAVPVCGVGQPLRRLDLGPPQLGRGDALGLDHPIAVG